MSALSAVSQWCQRELHKGLLDFERHTVSHCFGPVAMMLNTKNGHDGFELIGSLCWGPEGNLTKLNPPVTYVNEMADL